MAQANIAHIQPITDTDAAEFATELHRIVAKQVHSLSGIIEPDEVTVLTLMLQPGASISGADTEIQVLLSGNDWPYHENDIPYTYKEAKKHFNELAEQILTAVSAVTKRSVYVWVTPFVASGWAE